jgi:hypothetical protein
LQLLRSRQHEAHPRGEFGLFPTGGYSEHYLSLIEDLQQLVNRPIDLLGARAIRNPYVLDSVNRPRQLLYAA